MTAPAFEAPPWTVAEQPPCMPGCERDHTLPCAHNVCHGEGEWYCTGGITCTLSVLQNADMSVEVFRSANALSEDNWRVEVTSVKVYFSVKVEENAEPVDPAEALRLVAKLSAAVAEAAEIADRLNGVTS